MESSLVDSKAAMPTGSKEVNCRSAGLLCPVKIVGMLLTVVEGPRRSCSKTGLRRKLTYMLIVLFV